MFRITDNPIDSASERAGMGNPETGGYATFEGWVRNRNEGRDVVTLEYEAYGDLAHKETARILAGARESYDIQDARCVHRVGRLKVGDLAVWIGVTAKHRGPAFDACRFIIDELKYRVPIWKKEHYTDGDSGWVGCPHCAAAGASRHQDHSASPRAQSKRR